MFKHLKVGDRVWVQTKHGREGWRIITKVTKAYLYVGEGKKAKRFHRVTGSLPLVGTDRAIFLPLNPDLQDKEQ